MSHYYEDGLWLLKHCSLDPMTVRNIREAIIPALLSAPFSDEAEISEAVAIFESRERQQWAHT